MERCTNKGDVLAHMGGKSKHAHAHAVGWVWVDATYTTMWSVYDDNNQVVVKVRVGRDLNDRRVLLLVLLMSRKGYFFLLFLLP